MKLRIFFLFVFFWGLGGNTQAFSQEESFSLDEVEDTKPATSTHSHFKTQNFSIMGRVDLTFDKTIEEESNMRNRHFLLFLKAKASEKVSFLGEFVNESFFHVNYRHSNAVEVSFGKIMVPFGDERHYHSYYGGVQGYGVQGVMFPNIWAEPGFNVKWSLGPGKLDTYIVNGIAASNATSDVDLQNSTTERQAVGLRWSQHLMQKLHLILSAYYSDYWPGQPLYMGGLDLYSDYGLITDSLRFSFGVAQASAEGSPTGDNFLKIGDFYELATNFWAPMEWRVRYGSYDDDDRVETADDTQSLNVGVIFPVDVLRVLLEHQWNFEEVNEVDNDVGRVMVSLDF